MRILNKTFLFVLLITASFSLSAIPTFKPGPKSRTDKRIKKQKKRQKKNPNDCPRIDCH
jgi:hypothetical protein